MEQSTLGWGRTNYSLPWRGQVIRCVRTDDGREWRALKDLCTALGVDEEAQRQRILREKRWAIRTLKFQVRTGGGRQWFWGIERSIVKGWLYGVHPHEVSDDLERDLDALKDEMDRVLDSATFTSEHPELAAILDSVQISSMPTYPSDIPGVPEIHAPDEAEHALTHQLIRDLGEQMAGYLMTILRELQDSKDHLARLTERQTEVLGLFAEAVETMRGKQPIPTALRLSLYQAAWELNYRHCAGCGVALFHEDGRPVYGAMTLHHVAGLVSVASRLMPLCAFCNFHLERNVDLQWKVERVEREWFAVLKPWSKAYPAIRDTWARCLREARARAHGQARWLRWRHQADHQHFDPPGGSTDAAE